MTAQALHRSPRRHNKGQLPGDTYLDSLTWTGLLVFTLLALHCDGADQTSSEPPPVNAGVVGTGRGLSHRAADRHYRRGRRLDPGSPPLPLRSARAEESRRSDAAAPDYDGGDFDYPPYHSYWPPATATDKRKDGKGGHHYHHRHRQGRRRYDDFVGDYDSYDYYGGKHDYKHEYDIVFPLLILIMAPLAVSAFLLPITASLMTNTFFLVNGATSAAIQGRRRRRSLRQLAPSAEELRNLEEVLLRAISKYGDFEEAVVPESVKRGVLST
ncbi:uncharacterized protein LOC144124057 [Amblyomma americanum]